MGVLALEELPISPTPHKSPITPIPPPPPPNPNPTPPNTKLNALYPDHATTPHLDTTAAQHNRNRPRPHLYQTPKIRKPPSSKLTRKTVHTPNPSEPTHDDLQDSVRLVEDQISECNSTDSDNRSPGNALDRFRDAAERLFWREQARGL